MLVKAHRRRPASDAVFSTSYSTDSPHHKRRKLKLKRVAVRATQAIISGRVRTGIHAVHKAGYLMPGRGSETLDAKENECIVRRIQNHESIQHHLRAPRPRERSQPQTSTCCVVPRTCEQCMGTDRISLHRALLVRISKSLG